MYTGAPGAPPQPETKGIAAAYVGLILIWSTTPLAVVLSLRDLDAIWSLALRMVLAAALAGIALRVAGLKLARGAAAWRLYAIGSLSMFGAMLFTYLGARHLPSGMISVLFGLSPLMVGVLSSVFLPGVRLSPLQWVGMVLGLLGLIVIFIEGDKSAAIDAGSVLLVLLGVLTYAVSAVFMKQASTPLHPLVQTTGALWMSALGCVLVLPFLGGPVPLHMPGTLTVVALLYSASFGSIVAMLCYFFLLQHIAAGTVALTTLMTPVFALLLGMAINHERFHAEILWGMGLIFLGLLAYYEKEIRVGLSKKEMPA